MSEMISFGGGVNSVAMTILLVNERWRGPIVFADTGAEWPDTYSYMQMFEAEFLAQFGLSITILRPPSKYYGAWTRQLELEPYLRKKKVIPNTAGRWCTNDWKVRPIARWMKEFGHETKLLGIAADEGSRWKGQKAGVKYPLIEAGYRRQECKALIKESGFPIPHRSSCFFCPFQREEQWRELWQRYPDLYERAIQLEQLASERVGRPITFRHPTQGTLNQLRVKFECQLPLLIQGAPL